MALYLHQNLISAQYHENQLVEFHQILYMHLSWQDLPWDCYTSFFANLLPELWLLIYAKILFPFNILRQNFTKFYICIHIDKMYIGIVTHHFWHICTRVMTLDLRQVFVSFQYRENKLTDFHQILSMHSY